MRFAGAVGDEATVRGVGGWRPGLFGGRVIPAGVGDVEGGVVELRVGDGDGGGGEDEAFDGGFLGRGGGGVAGAGEGGGNDDVGVWGEGEVGGDVGDARAACFIRSALRRADLDRA